MQKTTIKFIGIFLVLAVLLGSFALAKSISTRNRGIYAGNANSGVDLDPTIIKIDIPRNVLIADGQTEYEAYIRFDNTPLNGAPTRGVEYLMVLPSELAPYITVTRAERRPENDFFSSVLDHMIFEYITPNWSTILQARAASIGVSSTKGNVAVYYFTVSSPGRILVGQQFDLTRVGIYGNGQEMQEYRVIKDRVMVIPSGLPLPCAISSIGGSPC